MEKPAFQTQLILPAVPLRGLVLLPGDVIHFDIAREESRSAVKAALEGNSLLFVSCQKDPAVKNPSAADVYPIGTVCRIRQTLNLPNGTMRVLVEGLQAAAMMGSRVQGFLRVTLEPLGDIECDGVLEEALRRRIEAALSEYAAMTTRLSADAFAAIKSSPTAGKLAYAAAGAAFTKQAMRQAVLDCQGDVEARLKLVLAGLLSETEIMKVDKRIAAEVKRSIDQNQHEYYLREQIKAIRKELGDTDAQEADDFLERLNAKKMPAAVRESMEREIKRFRELPASSHEQPQMRNYIECMLELPWEEETQDDLSIEHAKKILDEDHYGLDKIKQRILEHIAVARLTGKVNGQIICFVGPPGVGKTSIASSIARALGRNFVRMSLGGIHDEAEIRGHRRTYIGAMPGRVIAAMRKAGSINPLLLFDEIDKLTSDMRGDPAAAMLEVLDSAQNFAFRDHFLELEYDLSKVMFITTANDAGAIPKPLLDRMEVISLPGYLETEKVEIAKRHLLPKQLEKHGLTKKRLSVTPAALVELIRAYTKEAGVRELERELAHICRKAAMELGSIEHDNAEQDKAAKKITVGKEKLREYLGAPKFTHGGIENKSEIGLANGLAWTSFGGEMLQIEVQPMTGTEKLILTGSLGDVMQESARAALTFIKAHSSELGIAADFAKTDIHIHVPEGAVPKDGPSAGITLMTAITSALNGIPVKASVAMTGEITLRGRVLPIGGLREKLLAAYRAGIKQVLIPKDNVKDLEDVSKEVKDNIEIIPVSTAMEVLSYALTHMAQPVGEMPLSPAAMCGNGPANIVAKN